MNAIAAEKQEWVQRYHSLLAEFVEFHSNRQDLQGGFPDQDCLVARARAALEGKP